MNNLPLLSLSLLAAACASAPPADPDVLIARRVPAAPVLDGRDDDAAWRDAPEMVVPLEGASAPSDVRLRAIVHGSRVYVLARWQDSTEDRLHKMRVPKAGGGFENGREREDVFAIGFPISGEFTGDMLSPLECVWDVWQWKSARTDAAGFAMDKSHVHAFADPGGKRHEHAFDDGRKLYIRRPEDAGTSATATIPAPEKAETPMAQFVAQTPTGSAADVAARGEWRDGWWTLEMSRVLVTGHADDAPFGAADVPFAVAVLDRAEDEDHSTSPVRRLRIEP